MENNPEFKTLTMNLMKWVMESGRPKPTTTHGACDMCSKRTKHYYTDFRPKDSSKAYPKGKKLWWRCNKCKKRERRENSLPLKALTEEEFFKAISR